MRILGIALRMSYCLFSKIQMVTGGCFFQPLKFLLQQNHIDKGFINNSLGITWKFRLIYFKKGEIGCAISQQKNHSELEKFKKGNVADT